LSTALPSPRFGFPISSVKTYIAKLTQFLEAKPDLKFAITNIPQRTFLGGINEFLPQWTNDYNYLTTRKIEEWSTPKSAIALVKLLENYSCAPE
jgi:hypothetical protein